MVRHCFKEAVIEDRSSISVKSGNVPGMYLQVTQVAFLSLPIPNLIAMETRKNTGDKEFVQGCLLFSCHLHCYHDDD